MSAFDWGLEKSVWKDSNPLGKRAENFILENPQYLLYFRRFMDQKCPNHWDLPSESPRFMSDFCGTCWGFGVKTQPQLIPGRLSFGPGDVSPRENAQKGPAGYSEYFTTILHVPRAIKPELNDVVCVCEWNKPTQQLGKKPTGRVLKISAAYQIKTTNDYFERELAFFSCGLEIYDVQLNVLSKLLPNLKDIPIIDVKNSWHQNSYW